MVRAPPGFTPRVTSMAKTRFLTNQNEPFALSKRPVSCGSSRATAGSRGRNFWVFSKGFHDVGQYQANISRNHAHHFHPPQEESFEDRHPRCDSEGRSGKGRNHHPLELRCQGGTAGGGMQSALLDQLHSRQPGSPSRNRGHLSIYSGRLSRAPHRGVSHAHSSP
jgi:hypothetical protein